MALKDCKECGNPVSTQAKTCPSCGAPAPKRTSLFTWIMAGFFGLVFITMFANSGRGSGDKPTASSPTQTAAPAAAIVPAAVTPTLPETPATQWVYQEVEDPMTGKKARYAAVRDPKSLQFDFPYNGANYAYLHLRQHPKYGTDVYLTIDKGQLLCGIGSGCTVSIRLDDKPAKTYGASGSDDNDATVLFIHGAKKLIQEIKGSEVVRVQATVYKQGAPVMTFNTAGLEWN